VTVDVCEPFPLPPLPPPQAVIPAIATSPSARRQKRWKIGCLLRTPARRTPPIPSRESKRGAPRLHGAVRFIAVAVPEKVTVDVAAAPDGVIVAGLKLQLTPVGKPEQVKLTAELNPLLGVTVRVAVAAVEPVSDPLAGLIEIAKSGVGALIVSVSELEVDAAKLAPPVYCAAMVCVPTARLDVANVAVPEAFNVPEPIIVPPSVKFTVPDGVVEPEAAATCALKVRLAPVTAVVAEAVSVVVVATSATEETATVTLDDVLPVNVASPP
jgi:hypothetical protein